MPFSFEGPKIVTLQVKILPEKRVAFNNWQAKFHLAIAAFSGFISLEILSPNALDDLSWILIQRFTTLKFAQSWLHSTDLKLLKDELKGLSINHSYEETLSDESSIQNGITEIFITKVFPEQLDNYRKWMAKIHELESSFPGFKGVYVQSPAANTGHHWVTLLQFDKPENLDRWLTSPEREALLKQSSAFINSLESHRVISPFSGWFSKITQLGEGAPAVWKQSLLVLLVLFPIVMLEFKFLVPWTQTLDISIRTFIGNAISISLISWPMMPITIRFFGWWLIPKGDKKGWITLLGLLFVFTLYLIEIFLFWSFV
jgi:uncharacterized protein